MSERVEVACVCPGAPHATDTIVFRWPLDFRTAVTLRRSLALAVQDREDDEPVDVAAVTAALTEAYLLHGIASWTVVDDAGKPVPVTRGAIRGYLFANVEAAMVAADAADDLYSAAVIAPLAVRPSMSSRGGQTGDSTSPPMPSTATRRKRSKRSLTASTRTEGTEPTFSRLDGGFYTSQSRA